MISEESRTVNKSNWRKLTAHFGVGAFATALLISAEANFDKAGAAESDEVNLYSYRQPFLIKPILDAFTKETGIKVNVTFAPKGMAQRIKAEGRNTAADAVLTVDIGLLNALTEA